MRKRNLNSAAIANLSPQNRKLVRHFNRAGRITQRQAIMDYSIQSLTKRIAELRDFVGAAITSNFKNHPITGQRYCEYVWDGRTLGRVAT